MKTIAAIGAFVSLLYGCGGSAPLESRASGVWQMGYQGADPCVGEMDIDVADDGAVTGIYWCLTGAEGYVHGDIHGRQDGATLLLPIHRATVEGTATPNEIAGTATIGDQVFPFHAHR